MPIRDYRCAQGHVHEEVYLVGDVEPDRVPCPICGGGSRKVPARFAGAVDKIQRERAFTDRGLIPYERGVAEDAERNARYKEEALAAKISDVCAEVVRQDQTIRPD